MDITTKVLDVLIGLVIFFALLGVIVTATNNVAWATLNIGGTVYNLSWVPYILVLIILVGIVTMVVLHFKKK